MTSFTFSPLTTTSSPDGKIGVDAFQEGAASLPQERRWEADLHCQYQGFWFPVIRLESFRAFQQNFQAHNSDIILATVPRSCTIWLKSLIFAIINRTRYNLSQHPLLTNAPHQLVPFLESMVYNVPNFEPDFTRFESPRLFGTHIPYASLPQSIKDSDCKIIYLCRNPRDNFISLWQFMSKKPNRVMEPLSLGEAFGLYCRGISLYGPFWDHVLGFWKASLKRPEKVLFLKYEDMKKDTTCCLKKLAQFVGYPFSEEEESEGLIENISKLCSFEHLRNLDVNKNQISVSNFPRSILFRKAEVGDWVNYFTPSMVEQLDSVIEEKLRDTGLVFQYRLD